MKLAIFYPYFNRRGGVEKIIDFYLNKLTGITDLEIVCFALKVSADVKNDYQGRVTFKELKIPRFNPLLNHLCFFIWASRLVRFSKFDVYYSHFPVLSANKNLVYHVHSVHKSAIWAIEKNNGWLGKLKYCLRRYYPLPIILERLVFRFDKNKKFIAVSPKIKNEIVKEYKVPVELIYTISAPVNLEKLSFQSREVWREEAGRQYRFLQRQNWFWLGAVINRLTGKNIRLILESLAGVSRNIGLIIVGLPRKKDILRLRGWLKEFRIEKKVFLFDSRSDIEKVYPVFDFFISPSLYESFGLGVMEALLMGTPAVVSREIGCLDFIPSEIRREMVIEISDLKHGAELTSALGKITPIVMAEKDKKLSALNEYVRKLNEDGWSEIKNLLRL